MTKLRSMLFSLWFFAVSIGLATIGQLVALLAPSRLPGFAALWGRAVLAGLPICAIRYEVTGQENLPYGTAALIASMHQSTFDTVLWFQLVQHCHYVVKVELTRIPLFGRLVRMSGQIAVDRDGGAASLRGLLRDGGQVLAQGHQLVIFPEGTRAAAGEMARLQPGIAALARSAGVAVVPVVTDSGLRWGRGLANKHPGVIHVAILPPIEAGLTREALMTRLQAAFQSGTETLRQRREAGDNSVH